VQKAKKKRKNIEKKPKLNKFELKNLARDSVVTKNAVYHYQQQLDKQQQQQ